MMGLSLALRLARRAAPFVRPLLGPLAYAAGGAAALYFAPVIGFDAVTDRLDLEVAGLEAQVGFWREGYAQLEQTRIREAIRADSAVTREREQCRAELDRFERSLDRIDTLLTVEPERDEQGCPVRSMLGADQLRHALDSGHSAPG
jgi:hypothetical protein